MDFQGLAVDDGGTGVEEVPRRLGSGEAQLVPRGWWNLKRPFFAFRYSGIVLVPSCKTVIHEVLVQKSRKGTSLCQDR